MISSHWLYVILKDLVKSMGWPYNTITIHDSSYILVHVVGDIKCIMFKLFKYYDLLVFISVCRYQLAAVIL